MQNRENRNGRTSSGSGTRGSRSQTGRPAGRRVSGERTARTASQNRRSSASRTGAQRRTSAGTRRSTAMRNNQRRDDQMKKIGLIVLIILLVAVVIFALSKVLSGAGKKEETETTVALDTTVINGDYYLDLSGIISGDGSDHISIKGKNREEILQDVKGRYEWNLVVKNANPNLDSFEMPEIPEQTQTVEASEQTGEGIDNEGSEQIFEEEDPLASVTIRPSKDSFEVPDLIEENLNQLLDQIFSDNASITEITTQSSEETSEAVQTGSTYALTLDNAEEVMSGYAEQLSLLWDVAARNGNITGFDKDTNQFVFGGGREGYHIDQEDLTAKLVEAVNGKKFTETIDTVGKTVEGEFDEATAKSKYTTLSTAVTTTTNNSVRNKNIKLACEAINGTVLQPGEEFSFNDVVGERTEERGYGAAAAYNNGEVVQEIGGGVCQASTTLYNAVFKAGLQTTYRRSHTFEPNYVTPGKDATVSWGGPDYKFRNNSNNAIGIRASYENNRVTVSIYGIPILPEGVTWELSSEKIKDTGVPESSVIESGSPSKGSSGSVWEVRKVVKKNGEVVSDDVDHTTTYKGHTPTVLKSSLESSTAESSSAESSSQTAETSGSSTTEASEKETTKAAETTKPVSPTAETEETTAEKPIPQSSGEVVVNPGDDSVTPGSGTGENFGGPVISDEPPV